MSTNETVSDIVGKDLAYEERTKRNVTTKTVIGTIPVGIGSANWGPTDVATKLTKFEDTFGSPITRDDESKDYSGLAIYKTIDEYGVAPYAFFTRVADSSAQKASITINKDATFATLKGESKISGKNYAITSADSALGFKYKNNGNYTEVKVNITPSASIVLAEAVAFDNIDVTVDDTTGFYALSVGDLVKLEIDGYLKQYIVQTGDLFARLIDSAAGYLYTQANGSIGTSTQGYIDIQFENQFSTSLLSSAISSLFDNRSIVSVTGANDISDAATAPGTYKMKFSMSIDDGNYQSPHNYGEVTLSFVFDSGNPLFTNASELATVLTGLLVQAYINTGGITTSAELPITVTADGNKIKFATKDAGTHTLSFVNTDDVGTSALSLAYLIGIGDIPESSIGSAYTVVGDSVYVYGADFTCYSKETPESNQLTQNVSIQMNPIEQPLMNDVLNKLNAEFTDNNIDLSASFIITGSLVTGIRIKTTYYGVGNEVIVKNSTLGSLKSLFAIATDTDGIDVNNDESGVGGSLSGTTIGTAGSGDINNYVDRLAVAIKKHILNGMPTSGDPVSDDMTVANCPYLDVRNTEGTKYTIDIISQNIGANSVIKIYNFPVLYPTASVSAIVSSGSNTTISAIVAELNTLLASYGFSAAINSSGKLVIQANSSGSAYGIFILSDTNTSVNKSSANLLKYLGLKDSSLSIDVTETYYEGADAKLNLGTFKAIYTGKDGNKITIIKSTTEDGNSLAVWFRDVLQDTFYNYTVDVEDTDSYIGLLIANSSYASSILEFIAPEDTSSMEDIADGTYTLSGGTSGTVVDEYAYMTAIEEYKDIEEFQFDIIVISNMSSNNIITALTSLCAERKDCFAIIDPPETVAGKINGVAMGGEDDMIRWHNGQKVIDDIGTKSNKLNSKYITTYFPWILTNTPSTVTPKQWHAPSVEVLSSIINCDLMAGDKTSPPAGQYSAMSSVEALAHKIKNKGRLYDDKIGNNINPIVFTSKYGFVIDGQKTTNRDKTKYSRIHVMRIGLYIKRGIFNIAPDFFWKSVTTNTRNDFAKSLDDNLMKKLYDKSKIKSGYTIEVEKYNDAEVEAEDGMIAVIEWSPVGAIEKIKVISTMYEDVVTVTFE